MAHTHREQQDRRRLRQVVPATKLNGSHDVTRSEESGGTSRLHQWAEQFARTVTDFAGTTAGFILAVAVVLIWAVLGPVFNYNENWQLVINTGTTIVTFLMVFLIQRSQNKDATALHMKLNEIVAALPGASNRLVSSEDLTEAELDALRKRYRDLIRLTREEADLLCSHSVEEAARAGGRKDAKPGPHQE